MNAADKTFYPADRVTTGRWSEINRVETRISILKLGISLASIQLTKWHYQTSATLPDTCATHLARPVCLNCLGVFLQKLAFLGGAVFNFSTSFLKHVFDIKALF